MSNQEDLKMLMEERAATPWREVVAAHLAYLGLHPWMPLELRVSSRGPGDCDVFALAQRAVDAFFTAFMLYPTSLAVHGSVAQLFGAAEKRFVAKPSWAKSDSPAIAVLKAAAMRELGEGFQATPIRIEADDNLDIWTVAVRFSIDFQEYQEAYMKAIKRLVSQLGESQ